MSRWPEQGINFLNILELPFAFAMSNMWHTSMNCRHCLWILGNAPTLSSSGTIWSKLVRDAKHRGCFFNAKDDKSIMNALMKYCNGFGKINDQIYNINSLQISKTHEKVSINTLLVHMEQYHMYEFHCFSFASIILFCHRFSDIWGVFDIKITFQCCLD